MTKAKRIAKLERQANELLRQIQALSGQAPPARPPTKKSRSKATYRSDVTCPRCSRPMLRHEGDFGIFFGCSDYPRCRGTRQGDIPDPEPVTPLDREFRAIIGPNLSEELRAKGYVSYEVVNAGCGAALAECPF
jgi:ssDNA-binding Zn-finger/Zn-ribbon topoisomerase 1